jgi:hypothetical protein
MSVGMRILPYVNSEKFILYPNIQGMTFTQNILNLFNSPLEKQQRNDGLDNELTIVQVQPAFPLRYIEKLNGKYGEKYKERYEDRKESEVDVQIHLEYGRKFFDCILRPSGSQLLERIIHKLLILNALGVIKNDTQLGGFYIEIYENKKLTDYLVLGNNFRKAHENLNLTSDLNQGKDTSINKSIAMVNLIMKEKLDEVRVLDYMPKEERKKDILKKIDEQYIEIEKFFRVNDISKIPFWTKHAQLAEKVIEEL